MSVCCTSAKRLFAFVQADLEGYPAMQAQSTAGARFNDTLLHSRSGHDTLLHSKSGHSVRMSSCPVFLSRFEIPSVAGIGPCKAVPTINWDGICICSASF